MGNKRLYLHPAGANQTKELLHIAILGPTHVWQRIIPTLFFIERIVAAGPVGARHEELDLFAIHIIPGETQLYGTYIDDTAAIAADIDGQSAGNRRFGSRCNHDAIDALAVGESGNLFLELGAAHEGRVRT